MISAGLGARVECGVILLILACTPAVGAPDSGGSKTDDTASSADTHETGGSAPPPPCTAWGEPAITGTVVDESLNEISGVAPSIRNPGTLWVVEDRNNAAAVVGLDELGNTLLTIELEGVVNEDMEDLDVVPCGLSTCIVVADTGDNGHDRPEAAVVVFEEPALGTTPLSVEPVSYPFQWPEAAEDNESLTHTDDGRLVFATKRSDRTTDIYTMAAFTDGAAPEHVAVIPSTAPDTEGGGTQVTAIALWPDQSRLLIRTYREAFELVLDGGIDRVRSGARLEVPFAAIDHVEAVAYDAVRRGYWTIPESTPEGPSPILFAPCTDGLD